MADGEAAVALQPRDALGFPPGIGPERAAAMDHCIAMDGSPAPGNDSPPGLLPSGGRERAAAEAPEGSVGEAVHATSDHSDEPSIEGEVRSHVTDGSRPELSEEEAAVRAAEAELLADAETHATVAIASAEGHPNVNEPVHPELGRSHPAEGEPSTGVDDYRGLGAPADDVSSARARDTGEAMLRSSASEVAPVAGKPTASSAPSEEPSSTSEPVGVLTIHAETPADWTTKSSMPWRVGVGQEKSPVLAQALPAAEATREVAFPSAPGAGPAGGAAKAESSPVSRRGATTAQVGIAAVRVESEGVAAAASMQPSLPADVSPAPTTPTRPVRAPGAFHAFPSAPARSPDAEHRMRPIPAAAQVGVAPSTRGSEPKSPPTNDASAAEIATLPPSVAAGTSTRPVAPLILSGPAIGTMPTVAGIADVDRSGAATPAFSDAPPEPEPPLPRLSATRDEPAPETPRGRWRFGRTRVAGAATAAPLAIETPPVEIPPLILEDATAPLTMPAARRRRVKRSWREQRWERRRRRRAVEEAMAWVLVPLLLLVGYWATKAGLSALGTSPSALIQGFKAAISGRS